MWIKSITDSAVVYRTLQPNAIWASTYHMCLCVSVFHQPSVVVVARMNTKKSINRRRTNREDPLLMHLDFWHDHKLTIQYFESVYIIQMFDSSFMTARLAEWFRFLRKMFYRIDCCEGTRTQSISIDIVPVNKSLSFFGLSLSRVFLICYTNDVHRDQTQNKSVGKKLKGSLMTLVTGLTIIYVFLTAKNGLVGRCLCLRFWTLTFAVQPRQQQQK